ncbi:MAG: phage terminase small subunit P27 family [Azospirillum sp.]|nr:phage terminase small subunit P27 family [Azospirillum sp.]
MGLRGPLPPSGSGRTPVAKADLPSCPTWLDAAAKKEWRRVVPELAKLGLLARLDQAALASYCEAFATYAKAVGGLQDKGLIVVDAKGNQKPSPLVKIANDAAQRIERLAKVLGLTPEARQRLKAEPAKPPASDGFDDLLA